MSSSRLAAIFLIYLLAGPPIGGVIYGALVGIVTQATGDNGVDIFLVILMFAIPMAYLVGWVEALVTAIVIAAYAWRYASLPRWWLPVAAAVAAALPKAARSAEGYGIATIYLVTAAGAALACHRLVKHMLTRIEATPGET